MKIKLNFDYLYWILPLVIFTFQAIYTLTSANQVRLEEAIETFRSTWWFQNRLVWNGSYSFLGWYTTLVTTYNIFGMNIYTPKLVKLFFELIAYFCLASVLKKYLGVRFAWLPLLLVGLSPTFIYFNSLSLSMGLEVSFFVICLFLISNLDFKSRRAFIWEFGLWFIAMFAWLTYFGFLFYLPILGGIWLYKMVSSRRVRVVFLARHLAVSAFAFLLPLVLLFFYIENRNLLIYDPVLGRGLFRSFGSVELKPNVWLDNLERITSDLFVRPVSYYFEPPRVEFGDYYPILALLLVLGCSIYLFKKVKKLRLVIGSALVLMPFYLFVISIVGPLTLGGIRRGTILILLVYFLVVICYKYMPKKYISGAVLFLILFHHIMVYPFNLKAIEKPSIFGERIWFSQDPKNTFADLLNLAQKQDVILECFDATGAQIECGSLSLIYAAVSGGCYWGGLACHNVVVGDHELTLEMWGKEAHTEP